MVLLKKLLQAIRESRQQKREIRLFNQIFDDRARRRQDAPRRGRWGR